MDLQKSLKFKSIALFFNKSKHVHQKPPFFFLKITITEKRATTSARAIASCYKALKFERSRRNGFRAHSEDIFKSTLC